MSRRPEYVQLSANEDVNSIRDRLSFTRGQRVLLIWPEEGTTLTRKLDLVLVQREAKRRAVQIALVTHDEQVMQNASDLGISTFETIGASERGRWKRGRTRLFASRDQRPEDSPEAEELMPVASRVKTQRRIPWLRSTVARVLVLVFVVGAIAAAAYIIMPSATITLELFQDILQTDATIIADPDPNVTDIDVDNRVIPANVLRATVQTTSTLQTTGVENLADLPAIGVVIFTNQTRSRVEIPAGTTVSTSAGTPVLFQTIAAAEVPGGSGQQVEVAIEAGTGSTGDRGNVESGMINTVIGPLETQVSVINISPTTGGETREFASVTADDRERLLNTVRGQLQSMAYSEMQSQISDNQLIVIETIRIPADGERSDWTTFSADVGAVTDTLSLEMRATVEALAIDDRFARQIVFAELSAMKPDHLILLPDSFQYTRGFVTGIDDFDRVTFTAGGQAMVSEQIDTTALQEQLIGRPLDEASRWLAQNVSLMPGTAPIIQTEPEWLPVLPLLPLRIRIQMVNGA
jgi:hypothetical protein